MQTQTHMTAKELSNIMSISYRKITRILLEGRCPSRLSEGPNRYEVEKAKSIVDDYIASTKKAALRRAQWEQGHAD